MKDGDGEIKLRAAANLAVDPDAATVDFHDVLGDGKAEAGTAEFAGARSVHTVKALENAGLIRFGNADAGVRNGKNDLAIARFSADDNLAPRQRVLQSSVDEILQDFSEPAAVAGNIRHAAARLYGDGDLFFGGPVLRGLDAGLDKLRDIDSANLELKAVSIHFRKLQQVFREAGKASRMLDDDFEEALAILRIVHGAGEQRFRKTLNGRERSAELVGDVGHEIAAHALKSAQFGNVVKHDHSAICFACADRTNRSGEKTLAQGSRDDFGFHARFAGQNRSDCFDQIGLADDFDQGAARFWRKVEP